MMMKTILVILGMVPIDDGGPLVDTRTIFTFILITIDRKTVQL